MTKKISALPSATTPLAGSELVEIVQGGVSKRVASSYLGGSASAQREMLIANRTYYVRTDGNDSNNGLANTSGGAFLTIQKAVDVISSTLDIASGVTVTVQLGDGTYTGAVTLKKISGPGSVLIQGNTGALSNVIINPTAATCFTNSSGSTYTLTYMKLTTTTSGNAIYCGLGSLVFFNNINFGACPGSSHIMVEQGGRVQCNGSYSITGAAAYHNSSNSYGEIRITGAYTITITGTPAFSGSYIYSGLGFVHYSSVSFSGSATGKRYDVNENGLVKTYGGGASYFPGNSAGTTATGGQYT